MRIIAFINDADSVRKILSHIGESTLPPKIAPARGPLLWEPMADFGQTENDPQWDSSAQPEPAFEFDQRVTWWRVIFNLATGVLGRSNWREPVCRR